MSRSGVVRRLVAFGTMFAIVLAVAACGASAGAPTSAPAAYAPAGDPSAAEPAAGTPAPGSESTAGDPGQFIVRKGTLELEVADVDAATVQARGVVGGVGGYVSGSDESTKGERHFATITYRIPVDKWQDTITALRALGSRVVAENTSAEEVTSQVVDLGARIDNLRTAETSIREIMSRAGTIDDVLAVQQRLQSVQEEIERLVAQQQDLTGRAALATLAVTWENPEAAAVTEAQSGWNLGHEVDRALAQTVSAGQALASFLVWLLFVGVPVFGPIILLAVAVIWLVRRYQRRHPRPVQVGWGAPGGGYAQAAPAGWYPPQPGYPTPASPSAGEVPADEAYDDADDEASADRPPEAG